MTADEAIRNLCEKLDSELYIPVREELTQSHSLGNRKEDFKSIIESEVNKLQAEFDKRIDDAIEKVKKSQCNDAGNDEHLSHYKAGRYKYQYALKILSKLKEGAK